MCRIKYQKIILLLILIISSKFFSFFFPCSFPAAPPLSPLSPPLLFCFFGRGNVRRWAVVDSWSPSYLWVRSADGYTFCHTAAVKAHGITLSKPFGSRIAQISPIAPHCALLRAQKSLEEEKNALVMSLCLHTLCQLYKKIVAKHVDISCAFPCSKLYEVGMKGTRKVTPLLENLLQWVIHRHSRACRLGFSLFRFRTVKC